MQLNTVCTIMLELPSDKNNQSITYTALISYDYERKQLITYRCADLPTS